MLVIDWCRWLRSLQVLPADPRSLVEQKPLGVLQAESIRVAAYCVLSSWLS